MTAEECFTTTVRLSRRLSIEINTSRSGKMLVIWDPDVPSSLTPREQRLYEEARNKAIHKLVAIARKAA